LWGGLIICVGVYVGAWVCVCGIERVYVCVCVRVCYCRVLPDSTSNFSASGYEVSDALLRTFGCLSYALLYIDDSCNSRIGSL